MSPTSSPSRKWRSEDSRTRASTSQPRPRNQRQRLEPMKPLAPVMRTRLISPPPGPRPAAASHARSIDGADEDDEDARGDADDHVGEVVEAAVDRRRVEREDDGREPEETAPRVLQGHEPHDRGHGAVRAGDGAARLVDVGPDPLGDDAEYPGRQGLRQERAHLLPVHRAGHRKEDEAQAADEVDQAQLEEVVLVGLLAALEIDDRAEDGVDDDVEDIDEEHPFRQRDRVDLLYGDDRLEAEAPPVPRRGRGRPARAGRRAGARWRPCRPEGRSAARRRSARRSEARAGGYGPERPARRDRAR